MSNLNNRVEKLEGSSKGPKRIVVAWQQQDNKNLYELGHTGKMLTESELHNLDLGDNALLIIVDYGKTWPDQVKEVNNVKS